ncbi:MAG: hypothetical protein ABIF18_03645 [archaeon]
MILSRFNSRATVGVDDFIKWAIYFAIAVSAGVAVKTIVSSVIG